MTRGAPRASLWLLVALALALVLHPARAAAQDGATLVAIVTAEPSAPLTRRVRAELEGLGVDVLVIRPPAESSPARTPLDQAARGVGAIAAVRIVPSGAGVEVWVADRVTGKAVVRELVAPPKAGAASDAFIAVGVVELLRASLMELHTSEPRHGDAPVTERVRTLALPVAPPPPPPPLLGLSVGAGAELGLRLGASADGAIALWLRMHHRLGLRAFGALTLAPARTEVPQGSVQVASQRFGLTASYDLANATATWVPVLGIGALGARVTVSGTASPPFVGETASAWAAGPMLHVGLGWAFVRGLRLRGDATTAWALPTPRVRVLGAEVGRWGAPLVSLSLAVEVLWGPG
jgi:hypothetical protein